VSDPEAFGYALVGCGAFGRFCLDAYAALEGLAVRGVCDRDPDRAAAAAVTAGIDAVDFDALLAADDVHLVHLATPPATHVELARRALEAGKHVLCEKPLATDLAGARAMADLARERGLVLVANLVMRYDPLCEAVRRILAEGILGAPLYARFENCAKDEDLPPDHWFWDPARSGGIFVEHGVHFFDLFAAWFGPGEVTAADRVIRPGVEALEEQVRCTVRYAGGCVADLYHGFTQADRMDRQEFRIVCERGDLRLEEWVPTRLFIDALLAVPELARLKELLPGARCKAVARYAGDERRVYSRHRAYEVDGRYRLAVDAGMDKGALYAHVLRALLADQLAAMVDPGHERRVAEENGVASLAMALRARELSRGGGTA